MRTNFSRRMAFARSRAYHKDHPYVLHVDGPSTRSTTSRPSRRTRLFGGNSNWRGPVWFPVNYLLIESLQKFHHYYGDDFRVECPTGSGRYMTLWEVAAELSRRLTHIFTGESDGSRAGQRREYSLPRRSATGKISFCSTNISTATTARASARVTRQAGPDSSRS